MLLFIIICLGLTAADIVATLDSNNGTSGLCVKNSGSDTMAYIDSEGNMTLKGGLRLDSGGIECATAEMLIVDGKIGIGVTAPANELVVAGDETLSGVLYLGNPLTKLDSSLSRIVLPSYAIIQGGNSGTNASCIQFCTEAGAEPPAGYGLWMNYNAHWDGSDWIQHRGTQGSYMFTVGHHHHWSWRYATPNGVNGGVASPIELMYLKADGTVSVTGEIESNGSGDSYFKGNVGIGDTTPDEKLAVNGTVEVQTGGVVFPDATFQAVAGHRLVMLSAPQNLASHSNVDVGWTTKDISAYTGSHTAEFALIEMDVYGCVTGNSSYRTVTFYFCNGDETVDRYKARWRLCNGNGLQVGGGHSAHYIVPLNSDQEFNYRLVDGMKSSSGGTMNLIGYFCTE